MFHKAISIKLGLCPLYNTDKTLCCAVTLECTENVNDPHAIFTGCYFEQCQCIRIIWHYKNNKVDIPSCRRRKGTRGYLVFVMKPTDCNLYSHFWTFQRKGKEDGCSKRKGNEYNNKHEFNYLMGGFVLQWGT